MDRARSSFRSGGGRNNISVDIPPDLFTMMVDRRRIVQVLLNMLSNTASFSRQKPVASRHPRTRAAASPHSTRFGRLGAVDRRCTPRQRT